MKLNIWKLVKVFYKKDKKKFTFISYKKDRKKYWLMIKEIGSYTLEYIEIVEL
jgi:hypothetical protein